MKQLSLGLSIVAVIPVLLLAGLWLYGGSYAIHTVVHGRIGSQP